MKEGDPAPSRDGPPPVMCMFQTTGGRYFDAMGIPVIRGRTFDGRDRAGGPPVAIVDESLVARLFPAGENPVGHRIAFEAEGNPFGDDFRPLWREIVGLVGTVKHYGLLSSRPYVQVYVPHTQLPTYQQERRPAMVIAARLAAPADADAVVQHIRGTVAGIDPTLPVYGVRPMRQYVDADTEGARLASGLLAAGDRAGDPAGGNRDGCRRRRGGRVVAIRGCAAVSGVAAGRRGLRGGLRRAGGGGRCGQRDPRAAGVDRRSAGGGQGPVIVSRRWSPPQRPARGGGRRRR
jgi:hypothetical protein